MPIDLTQLIKAYDVRGTVPDQFNPQVARAIGAAFARVVVLPEAIPGEPPARPSVAVGRDMRDSGPELVDAFAQGLADAGVDVIRIGLCSTDGPTTRPARWTSLGPCSRPRTTPPSTTASSCAVPVHGPWGRTRPGRGARARPGVPRRELPARVEGRGEAGDIVSLTVRTAELPESNPDCHAISEVYYGRTEIHDRQS